MLTEETKRHKNQMQSTNSILRKIRVNLYAPFNIRK